ncbi:MAG: hypothetical protein LBR07_03110 [Puniceicoccales bacterium]|jgi:hypothetical protein|nr:hypothetical protein [Puniceicoccales bacterium]
MRLPRLAGIALVACLLLLAATTGAAGNANSALEVVARNSVVLTKPQGGVPVTHSAKAPLLGNGSFGAALGGTPDKLCFHIARNDFWRLKDGHDEAWPAALGKISLDIPALKGASYFVEHDIAGAVFKGRFEKPATGGTAATGVTLKAWLAATADVLVIEITPTTPAATATTAASALTGTVSLDFPGAAEMRGKKPLFPADYDTRKSCVTCHGIATFTRGFEGVDIPTKSAAALLTTLVPATTASTSAGSTGTGAEVEILKPEKPATPTSNVVTKFTLTPGKTLRLLCATNSNFKSRNAGGAVKWLIPLAKQKSLQNTALADLENEHKNWWKNYWEKSWVALPATTEARQIEKQYYLSLYGLAATSRDPDFPPGLFGIWTTAEIPAWSGDYHLNYNYQAAFYGLYNANRLEQANTYWRPLLAFMEKGRKYAQALHGIEGESILYPVGIGPLGIDSVAWTPRMEKMVLPFF